VAGSGVVSYSFSFRLKGKEGIPSTFLKVLNKLWRVPPSHGVQCLRFDVCRISVVTLAVFC
jgi:hypothetical protein